jgi:hypothetical protein
VVKTEQQIRKPRSGPPKRKPKGSPARAPVDRGPKGAIEREKGELDRALYFVRSLEAIAKKAGDDAAEEIRRLAREQAEESRPLRVRLVRDLLGVSDHTVTDWCSLGILEERGDRPRRVSLPSVLRAKEAIDAIRSAGQDRNLTSAVMNRLELDELREDQRFRDSLAQAKRGERGEWPKGF